MAPRASPRRWRRCTSSRAGPTSSWPRPPNGIEDAYVNAFVNLKAVGGLETLNVVLGYHDYEAERISADYGSEVNVSVAAKLKKVNFMLKYADYQQGVLASARDTEKYWMQIEFVW